MGKQITTLINRFDGGISNDLRINDASKYGLTKHFDAFTYPHKLKPYRSTETDETGATGVKNFLYVRTSAGAASYQIYGLGTDGATSEPCLYLYDIDTGFAGGWQGGSYFKSALSGINSEIFFYYKSFIYVSTGVHLIRCDITTATNQFVDDWASGQGIICTAAPVHHPVDDNAYFFATNIVYKWTNSAWTTAFTLNADLTITSACAYGNYLAVAAVTRGGSDYKSYVFLWDRDATSWNEIIDFGGGKIVHLVCLDNKLLGVMKGSTKSIPAKIIVKQISGNFGVTINELQVDAGGLTTLLPSIRHIKENKLFFPALAELNGDHRYGVWALDSNGKLSLEFVEEAVGTGNYNGILSVGNIWFIAHSDDGSINRTDDQGVYTYASSYESLIFNNGDSNLIKKLLGVSIITEPLVANDNLSLVLKYRINENIECAGLTEAQVASSWTTILTRTTANANAISHEAVNIESSGANLPEYKEIQFRIESESGSTGPIITGLKFKSEIIDKSLY